ncbi:hypothetical protein [Roseateles sp.]|jgi:hypothetical protein
MWTEFLLNCAAAFVFFLAFFLTVYYIAYRKGVFDVPDPSDGSSPEGG